MAAGGISVERFGRFARLQAPGQDHLFRIDKLAGGSADSNGIELLFTPPLDRLSIPCPNELAAAELWDSLRRLIELDAQFPNGGRG